ncbi:MAG: DUF4363 family protein [Clostridiaceae bacterium]|nr:DUF4363 family protein [Clostridiaceae bacterium]
MFILIMQSGAWLKKPIGNEYDFPELVHEIIDDIKNEEWDKIAEKSLNLENTWKRILVRIQFSSERDEINFINTALSRLKGAIMAEDKTSALLELNEALSHYNQLAR